MAETIDREKLQQEQDDSEQRESQRLYILSELRTTKAGFLRHGAILGGGAAEREELLALSANQVRSSRRKLEPLQTTVRELRPDRARILGQVARADMPPPRVPSEAGAGAPSSAGTPLLFSAGYPHPGEAAKAKVKCTESTIALRTVGGAFKLGLISSSNFPFAFSWLHEDVTEMASGFLRVAYSGPDWHGLRLPASSRFLRVRTALLGDASVTLGGYVSEDGGLLAASIAVWIGFEFMVRPLLGGREAPIRAGMIRRAVPILSRPADLAADPFIVGRPWSRAMQLLEERRPSGQDVVVDELAFSSSPGPTAAWSAYPAVAGGLEECEIGNTLDLYVPHFAGREVDVQIGLSIYLTLRGFGYLDIDTEWACAPTLEVW